MLKENIYLYSLFLALITISSVNNGRALARNHHKKGPPPPITVPTDHSLNPRQSPDDISDFAKKAAEKARQQQANIQSTQANNQNGPPALLPGHYTKRSQKTNGNAGWINSKRKRGKYDMGINMPVPQTSDPTQNKTRGVFRRSMPVYEPNY